MQDDWVRKLGDRSSSVKRLDTSASASASASVTEVRMPYLWGQNLHY